MPCRAPQLQGRGFPPLARQIAHAKLVITESSSHFLWFGQKSEQEGEAVAEIAGSIEKWLGVHAAV
jgi:hypothetical protein